ncbi:MAG: DUF4426 domain-containing protein [Proteobacteria bacterium]|nr:DUF4426 domain-containing protein [Pseudomonadota bacterium]
MRTLFRQLGKPRMWVAALTLLFALQPAHAQQMQRFGDYELHYIVIPTTMLKPDIAARYNIRRGKDRALCNISVIDNNGVGVKAALEGSSQNLLGQRQGLTFTEVVDGDAIYYLATIRHANEEVHRIDIDAQVVASPTSKGASTTLKLTQKLYWAE